MSHYNTLHLSPMIPSAKLDNPYPNSHRSKAPWSERTETQFPAVPSGWYPSGGGFDPKQPVRDTYWYNGKPRQYRVHDPDCWCPRCVKARERAVHYYHGPSSESVSPPWWERHYEQQVRSSGRYYPHDSGYPYVISNPAPYRWDVSAKADYDGNSRSRMQAPLYEYVPDYLYQPPRQRKAYYFC
ncbi:hypothetical protein WG66_007654 [Moniliophthora roreri]|uniref:Uncharacterized protein n=1 Tax=Moniliophthora roreri TaxID=221103 RepID=A0A0W0F3T8_MONRR|nr:hypothetical protein WG66_007654 [Moniliophthora roreri]